MSDLINFATAVVPQAPARKGVSLNASNIYGVASMAMFIQGYSMWYSYPHQVKINPEIPERPTDVADWDYTTFDKTWAWGTLEMSAWTFASRISTLSFGAGFTLWAMNLAMDNEGGDLHRLFYRSAQY